MGKLQSLGHVWAESAKSVSPLFLHVANSSPMTVAMEVRFQRSASLIALPNTSPLRPMVRTLSLKNPVSTSHWHRAAVLYAREPLRSLCPSFSRRRSGCHHHHPANPVVTSYRDPRDPIDCASSGSICLGADCGWCHGVPGLPRHYYLVPPVQTSASGPHNKAPAGHITMSQLTPADGPKCPLRLIKLMQAVFSL